MVFCVVGKCGIYVFIHGGSVIDERFGIDFFSNHRKYFTCLILSQIVSIIQANDLFLERFIRYIYLRLEIGFLLDYHRILSSSEVWIFCPKIIFMSTQNKSISMNYRFSGKHPSVMIKGLTIKACPEPNLSKVWGRKCSLSIQSIGKTVFFKFFSRIFL